MIAFVLNFAAVFVFLGSIPILLLAALNRQRGPALVFMVVVSIVITVLMAAAGDF